MKQFKILIVEDQRSLREAYAKFLEHAGFLVCMAEGYEDARPQIDTSIDLALLDVQLVGKSGLEILKLIRKLYPNCPVIMMSGYADKKNTLEALRQGAVEYLEKPVNPHELVRTVKHWLDFRTLIQENQRLQDTQAIHQRLKENEAQIRKTNERLNFLLTSTAAVIYAADISENFATTFISDNVERLTGYSAEAFTSDPNFRMDCIHPDDLERVRNELNGAIKSGVHRLEYRFQHRDGNYFWVADEVRVEKDSQSHLEFLGYMADISQRKQTEEKIKTMAYNDLLTGLPNRSLYYDRLKQTIAQSRRNKTIMAVLFLDLDYFKPINDELGHEWGDRALVEVGKRLKSCIRETDTVARIGGDEFSIILNDIASEKNACQIADKIIACTLQPMVLKQRQYVLGISIGICMESHQYGSVETIMRLADDAMYQAKQLGRNRYCIHRDSDSNAMSALSEELKKEKALRQAIVNNELVIYYQPKVDLKEGEITGMHALLRWNRGAAGIVLPDQFLPMANRTGLIIPIGEWVLRKACQQNSTWQKQGLPTVPISVNITSEQLKHPRFTQFVADTLMAYDLSPDMLEVEISEYDLMQHGTSNIDSLNRLNELGIKITIDNFGAGFFSLQSLKAMPVHELKINRSLVKQIGAESDSSEIANAIIAMGHILNHQVVAEGVETADQLEFLRQHDSDGMLGYLSSPPVPADEIAQHLKRRQLEIEPSSRDDR